MMDLKDAIEIRRSRRKYIPTSLKSSDLDSLLSLISELNTTGQVKMRLILDNGDAFNGFRKSYGMLSGVRSYVALIGRKDDVLELEKLGYYGEWLTLHATALGLGTCWVGGTFDRDSCSVELNDDERIVCAITVGNIQENLSAKEKFIHRLTHRKSKTIDQMYISDEPVPDWFISGMNAVQKAPSAINRQPVIFTYKDGVVTAAVNDITGDGFTFDLWIAKLHFELGAGGGVWDFGNGAGYKRI
jgi:nitroreductase